MEKNTNNTFWNAIIFSTIVFGVSLLFATLGGVWSFVNLVEDNVNYDLFFITILYFLRALEFSAFSYVGMLIAWKLGFWKVNNEIEVSPKKQ